jgi:Spy/CpxP family protein refolding chaperone
VLIVFEDEDAGHEGGAVPAGAINVSHGGRRRATARASTLVKGGRWSAREANVFKHTKRWVILGAAAAAIVIAASVVIVAQAQGRGPRSHGFGPFGHARGAFGWALLQHALDDLDVSQSQREQLHGVLQGRRDEIRAVAQRFVAAGRSLTDLALADQVDEAAIRAQAAALGDAAADAALLRASIHAQTAQILTPEQQQALREHRTRFRARIDEGMKRLDGELNRRLEK